VPVTHGLPTITINHDHQFMVSDPNATLDPTGAFGFFARDTRFVSSYSVTINGRVPLLLDASTIDHFSVRHEFTTPELPLAGTQNGAEHDIVLKERAIGFRLDRTIFEGIHEDYDLVSYAPHPVRLILEVAIESDFADIFDVRRKRLVRRGDLQSSWHEKAGELRTTYTNGSFKRELHVSVEREDSHPEFANGRMQCVINLAPNQTWHACVEWLPVIGGKRARVLPCSAIQNRDPEMATGVLPAVDVSAVGHATLPRIWRQAVADMEALRMSDFAVRRGVYIPAAGIPWYVTLFGRDSLVVAMESISGFPEFAFGALDRLSRVQATDDNAEQDKEPGKIPHELRYGELASLRLLPFTPYYGTADATLLFLIVFSYAYQWSGDKGILDRYRPNAEAALKWMLGARGAPRPRRAECGGRAKVDARVRGSRWRRFPGVQDALAGRLLQPGLERFARWNPARGRHDSAATDCAVRAPGLRVRCPAAHVGGVRDLGRCRAIRGVATASHPPLRGVQRAVLV